MPLVQPVDLVPAAEVGPVHFIAIGGAGMSGIAQAYADLGRVDVSRLRQYADLKTDWGVDLQGGHGALRLHDL